MLCGDDDYYFTRFLNGPLAGCFQPLPSLSEHNHVYEATREDDVNDPLPVVRL